MQASVLLIFKRNNQILLQLRNSSRKDYPNAYLLPGGMVEDNESIFEAAIREAEEELGVKLQTQDLQLQHCGLLRRNPKDYVLLFYINVTAWQGEIINKEPEKHLDVTWFDSNKLPENLAPHNRDGLVKISENIFYTEDLDKRITP